MDRQTSASLCIVWRRYKLVEIGPLSAYSWRAEPACSMAGSRISVISSIHCHVWPRGAESTQSHKVKQESRAVARKPRDAAHFAYTRWL